MIECIKFGNCKVNTIQVGDDCYVAVKNIGISLDVNNDTLKGIVRNHLPSDLRYSRKYIGLDILYGGAKLFTTIAGACRVILGSTHPDKFDVLDILIERHVQLQDHIWQLNKKELVTLDDSIPLNYYKDLHFVFKLDKPAILSSKHVAYQYACLRRHAKEMKHSIKKFREKHPGSVVLLKLVNDPLRTWEKNRSITVFRYYFNINKGHDHILEIDDEPNEEERVIISDEI